MAHSGVLYIFERRWAPKRCRAWGKFPFPPPLDRPAPSRPLCELVPLKKCLTPAPREICAEQFRTVSHK